MVPSYVLRGSGDGLGVGENQEEEAPAVTPRELARLHSSVHLLAQVSLVLYSYTSIPDTFPP